MTRPGIFRCFRVLEAAGLPRPYTCAQEASDSADVWRDTLPELSDEQLLAATRAHLRSERSRWWPTPGELLRGLPREAIEEQPDGDYPGRRWGALADGQRRIALLDQAHEELPGADMETVMRRADELAELAEISKVVHFRGRG